MVFTGLIKQAIGTASYESEKRLKVVLGADDDTGDFEIGESVAINGVCLTVTLFSPEDNALYFDISSETKRIVAPFGGYTHIEKAMTHGDRYGGHYVSGHIWGTGHIESIDPESLEMIVSFSSKVLGCDWKYKDSITVHGVSLTIAEVLPQCIKIALIPHTLQHTIFGMIESFPYCVNIEPNCWVEVRTESFPYCVNIEPNCWVEVRTDNEWMQKALLESEKGRYTAPPNPWVGAILVDTRTNTLVGRGYHYFPGTPHAERHVNYRNGDWSGCTLYVTLEPCHHAGRTPPCDQYLIERRVERVVVGIADPDPRVSGEGVKALRQANIKVDVLNDERVRHSLRSYIWHRTHNNRPYVVCKLAVTLDHSFIGKITSDAALSHAHRQRAESQMIVVGKHTDTMDNPQLTVRHGYEDKIRKQPIRYVARDRNDLGWCTQPNSEVLQILVEGGPTLQASLLEAGLVNEFVLYTATGKTLPHERKWVLPSHTFCSLKLLEQHKMNDNSGDIMQRFLVDVTQQNTEEEEEPVVWGTMEEAKEQLLRGGLVIVMDDESRENEGDLMQLASHASRSDMTFIIRHTTGIVCVAITPERAQQLQLSRLSGSGDKFDTPFTISVDHCTTHTGVSAEDRFRTAKALSSSATAPSELQRPGHMFPLIANIASGRRGHTEAGVALAQMVGEEAMVLAELYNSETGDMMRLNDCVKFAKLHNLPLLRMLPENSPSPQPSPQTTWCNIPLGNNPTEIWQLGIINNHRILRRTPFNHKDVTLRIHSDCWTGDTLGSLRCDCGQQLSKALHGGQCNLIIFPPNHEGRGIGLASKIEAYHVQDTQHVDTFMANKILGHGEDERQYTLIASILRQLECPQRVKLLTCNPAKEAALRAGGFEVERLALHVQECDFNAHYLATKHAKFKRAEAETQRRVIIIQAQWHAEHSDKLVAEVKRILKTEHNVEVDKHVKVPGCWELLHEITNFDPQRDIIFAVGILLKGETIHFEEIAREVNGGLRELIVSKNFAIVNSVLVCLTESQITDRCDVGARKNVAHGMADAIMHYKKAEKLLSLDRD
jgi:3,4-dihydroxy 2-butanone 4-phosphate synthase/GTP cyclohydrolase II